MRRKHLLTVMALVAAPVIKGAPIVVCDFEDFEIGQRVEMWDIFGGNITSTATVEADPNGTDNKVLHVKLNNWNTFIQLPIPGGLQQGEVYSTLMVDVYRAASDANDYKQFRIFIGEEEVLQVDGYPHQGDKKVWQHRTYNINTPSSDNSSSLLRLGMHSEQSDYYIDNVVLKGKYDDFTVDEDGVIDICQSNTSSNYVTYDTPLRVDKAHPLKVYTSRYTEFKSPVVGDGDISMYCGGERTFLGEQNGSAYPDWSEYNGDLHIYPYREVEPNAGFYGLVLNHGGKRFNPEDIEGSLATTNSQLINNTIHLHSGATLALPTGVRGVRIGHIVTDADSRITGPMKTSTSNAAYFVLGASGNDAELSCRIAPTDKDGKPFADMLLGIVKEGNGTYRITGNDNLISGAVRVLDGQVMLNNDAAEAKSRKMPGAIGALKGDAAGVYVFEDATVGGYGNCASPIDLYGTLQPGDESIATLTLADYASDKEVDLRLRPTSRLYFEIESADTYDNLLITGNAEYRNIGQDFQPSTLTPIIYLIPNPDNTIKEGDTFTLIRAKGKTSSPDSDWKFRIQYPKSYTWEVTETEEDGTYCLTARVTSLTYSGQGDVIIDNGAGDVTEYLEDETDDFDETSDPTALRTYAESLNKYVGTALSVWRTNLDNDTDPVAAAAAREFNMTVAENEMKFDTTEPSRGTFNYADADRIARYAQRHDLTLRGHALAWHKQMPSWLSSDGGVKNNNNYSRKELLTILENHITNIAGHFKGKVKEWDVVNECLSDDQSTIRTNPDSYDLRPSVWYTGIGEDYIDSAFVYAHRADPDALLILNEYGAEFLGNAKTEALFNLAKRLKGSGIPIHGVGLQCHLDVGQVDGNKLSATIDRYAEIGLSVIITELDLGVSGTDEASYAAQADDYRVIAAVAARNPNCRGMVVWGFSDDLSWRSSHPLLFDSAHNPKPAYYGVHGALRRAVSALGNEETKIVEAEAISEEYYTIQGQRITHPSGLTIILTHYSDGSSSARKCYVGQR